MVKLLTDSTLKISNHSNKIYSGRRHVLHQFSFLISFVHSFIHSVIGYFYASAIELTSWAWQSTVRKINNKPRQWQLTKKIRGSNTLSKLRAQVWIKCPSFWIICVFVLRKKITITTTIFFCSRHSLFWWFATWWALSAEPSMWTAVQLKVRQVVRITAHCHGAATRRWHQYDAGYKTIWSSHGVRKLIVLLLLTNVDESCCSWSRPANAQVCELELDGGTTAKTSC